MNDEIDYTKFDAEVVPLCRAMNDLPGIHTVDSCSGHGKRSFCIYFRVDEEDHRGLFILARSTDRRYFKHGNSWHITLSIRDVPRSPLPLIFVLESNDVGERAYAQANDLVENIFHHRNHKAFLSGYGIEECVLGESTSLEEAIADSEKLLKKIDGGDDMVSSYHNQLVEWLKELKGYREGTVPTEDKYPIGSWVVVGSHLVNGLVNCPVQIMSWNADNSYFNTLSIGVSPAYVGKHCILHAVEKKEEWVKIPGSENTVT